MKMTLIDFAIVFAVTNVMLAGMFTKSPPPEMYTPPPICNPEKNALPAENSDPRCAFLNASVAPDNTATSPVQTLPKSTP